MSFPYEILSFLLYGSLAVLLFVTCYVARYSAIPPIEKGRQSIIATTIVCGLVILVCIIPMSWAPLWNGDVPDHRNQYELMADSIIAGHEYLDLEVSESLAAMENPYDPYARVVRNVDFHWDHAYYNGRYYMYFGIVPALLLFVPFKLITGTPLVTYHATQIFIALFIIGMFALFWLLKKRFFRYMPLELYLSLSASLSIMSSWYSSSHPAMYCTAISAGMCLAVWSLYLFIKALSPTTTLRKTKALHSEHPDKTQILSPVDITPPEGKTGRHAKTPDPSHSDPTPHKTLDNLLAAMRSFSIPNKIRRPLLLFFGALLAAATFGCRPTIGLFNILLIPIIIRIFSTSKKTGLLILDLTVIAVPYILVACGLMQYNFIRFDNPFEFGQSYQLTNTDQSSYAAGAFDFDRLLATFFVYFFDNSFSREPYMGIFFNFPLLLFAFGALFSSSARSMIRKSRMRLFLTCLFVSVLIIAIFECLWSPFILERYRSDVYWLLGIGAFCLFGFWIEGLARSHRPETARYLSGVITILGVLTIFWCILLFLMPTDYSFTDCSPAGWVYAKKILTLGLL